MRMADPKDSEREIWIKVGQRFVVDFLKTFTKNNIQH